MSGNVSNESDSGSKNINSNETPEASEPNQKANAGTFEKVQSLLNANIEAGMLKLLQAWQDGDEESFDRYADEGVALTSGEDSDEVISFDQLNSLPPEEKEQLTNLMESLSADDLNDVLEGLESGEGKEQILGLMEDIQCTQAVNFIAENMMEDAKTEGKIVRDVKEENVKEEEANMEERARQRKVDNSWEQQDLRG